MRTLALDLSLNATGYAAAEDDILISSGTLSPDKKKTQYGRIQSNLDDILSIIRTHEIDQVFIEDIAYKANQSSSKILCEQQGIVKFSILKLGISVSTCPITAIKLFISGSGTASKQDVIKAVEARGYTPGDDNEADAIAIWLYAINQLEIETINF